MNQLSPDFLACAGGSDLESVCMLLVSLIFEQLIVVHKILHVLLKIAFLRPPKKLIQEGIMILTIVSPNTGIIFFCKLISALKYDIIDKDGLH